MKCPSEKTIVAFAKFELPDAEGTAVRAHVAVCLKCEDAVEWIRTHVLSRPAFHEDDDDQSSIVDTSVIHLLSGHGTPLLDERIHEMSHAGDTETFVPGCPAGLSQPPVATPQLDPSDFPGAIGRVGRYAILEMLASGGFGVVYRGWDPVAHQPVAIKMLRPDRLSDRDSASRIRREIRAAAIRHPHVVSVLCVGEHRELPFVVMEHLPGGSLRQRLRNGTPIPPKEILRYAAHVASGLAAIHAAGLIHRDLKPANILLDASERGVAKISDFGLACSVDDLIDPSAPSGASGDVMIGTPPFMAPEQLARRKIDMRSDLFSMGCLFYALVTGQSPFQGRFTEDSLQKVAKIHPPNLTRINPAISAVLADMVDRLLQKDCEERVQSADEVAEVLSAELHWRT